MYQGECKNMLEINNIDVSGNIEIVVNYIVLNIPYIYNQ